MEELKYRDEATKYKQRFKDLFRKDKKEKKEEDVHPADPSDVDDFLRGGDKLNFPAPTPDLLPSTRVDTSTTKRWPTAAEVRSIPTRERARTSPKRNKKGLMVTFTDEKPEIIGEGGDEAEAPTITLRRRANTQPQTRPKEGMSADRTYTGPEQFGPIKRTQTGFVPEGIGRSNLQQLPDSKPSQQASADRRQGSPSFATKAKADMRAGEGRAFLQGTPKSSPGLRDQFSPTEQSGPVRNETKPDMQEPPRRASPNANAIPIGASPRMIPAPLAISKRSASAEHGELPARPKPIARSTTSSLHDVALALGDEAVEEFSKRVAHLFNLFRLSAESVRPLSSCSPEDCMNIALWWFISGRLDLEATARDRPDSVEAQQYDEGLKQQAYADLAKSLWIIQSADSIFNLSSKQGDSMVSVTRQSVLSGLRKLTMSMKRHGLFPSEDASLPQGLDSTIFVPDKGNRSLVASMKQSSFSSILESMPLGDTSRCYFYTRFFAQAIIAEDTEYQCPVLVSLVRRIEEKELSIIVSSQNGSVKINIQGDKARGPTWQDISMYKGNSSSIEIQLHRGFLLTLNCSEHDVRTFWATYDHQEKVFADFRPKQDEEVVFDTTLRAFQYSSHDQALFPKEPIPQCRLRLLEKSLVVREAALSRRVHCGFRLCIITTPAVKMLKALSQELPSSLPIHFDTIQGESGYPEFILLIDDQISRYRAIFTFEDKQERSSFHACITGNVLQSNEAKIIQGPIAAFSMEKYHPSQEDRSHGFSSLAWHSFRVLTEHKDPPKDLEGLSDHLCLVMDFSMGSFTDRINPGPGETRFRLDVNSLNDIKFLRPPQENMTLSLLEKLSKEDLPEILRMLNNMRASRTIRTYTFPSLTDLHLFQAALTGFSVKSDCMASSFNISRRRMVVPIYKKWDASITRVQIVEKAGIVQLLAFFFNFSHGDCMSFLLKSTDIFESSGKNGKFCVRIVDAKFALPHGIKSEDPESTPGFVCLDMPEYPSQHDDVTITFDSEQDHEKFVQALPASAREISRMGALLK